MADVLLEVQNLKKYFPVGKRLFGRTENCVKAVDDVSFTIKTGETLGLIGESGCGKTTVGKLVMNLYSADSGKIFFEGDDITHLGKKEMMAVRQRMQMVFQDPYGSLNPRMTVRQLVQEPMLCHKILARGDSLNRTIELLEMVGLRAEDLNKYPHEFSGGQRQRIVIARALSLNPKLLICDEPVSALDVSIQAQVLNLMKEIQKKYGIAYLFVAHGMPVIRHISDRVGIMYMGRLVEVASTAQVFANTLHPYAQALISAVPVPDPTRKKKRIVLEGEVPSPIHLPSGCRFHTRCAHCMEKCRQQAPSLREYVPGHFVACHLYNED